MSNKISLPRLSNLGGVEPIDCENICRVAEQTAGCHSQGIQNTLFKDGRPAALHVSARFVPLHCEGKELKGGVRNHWSGIWEEKGALFGEVAHEG